MTSAFGKPIRDWIYTGTAFIDMYAYLFTCILIFIFDAKKHAMF